MAQAVASSPPSLDLMLPRRAWTEVDLGAIARNFDRVAARLAPGVRVHVSIKKDAYGHGASEVARALSGRPRLAGFGVATVEEGLRLRESAPRDPILVFSFPMPGELEAAIHAELELTITGIEDARETAAAAASVGEPARVHLKVDTGLGRLGRRPEELLAEIAPIRQTPGVELTGVYSHLAAGRDDLAYARGQGDRFAAFVRAAGLLDAQVHLGGSNALALGPQPGAHALRTGIAIYGYHPEVPGLEPAMTFKTRVLYRKRGRGGDRISYGGTHTLERDTELAIIGAGSGNGYPWRLANRGAALIGGRRCPILGCVCMDQAIVDVKRRARLPARRRGGPLRPPGAVVSRRG